MMSTWKHYASDKRLYAICR